MPIYTRTGDRGTTALFGGKRVLKCDELVDVYGSIDELNSWIGLVSEKCKVKSVKSFLTIIQSDLFTIGSSLAGWKGDLSRLSGRVIEMEKHIDEMDKYLPQLRNFILPGGSEAGSFIHIARAMCRRLERQTVALAQNQEVDARIIKYLNRLSDLLFMEARFINKKAGVKETVWSGMKKKHQ